MIELPKKYGVVTVSWSCHGDGVGDNLKGYWCPSLSGKMKLTISRGFLHPLPIVSRINQVLWTVSA